jgi:hypothetical protein
MQINLNLCYGVMIEYDSNLKEYLNILPKSINIQNIIKGFDDIKPILDSIDPSILSFSDISVELLSPRNFEQLLMLSNLAKSIQLYMDDEVNKWNVEEFPLNYKSITDTIIIRHFRSNDFQIQVLNVFQNIKRLTLDRNSCIVENSG